MNTVTTRTVKMYHPDYDNMYDFTLLMTRNNDATTYTLLGEFDGSQYICFSGRFYFLSKANRALLRDTFNINIDLA